MLYYNIKQYVVVDNVMLYLNTRCCYSAAELYLQDYNFQLHNTPSMNMDRTEVEN